MKPTPLPAELQQVAVAESPYEGLEMVGIAIHHHVAFEVSTMRDIAFDPYGAQTAPRRGGNLCLVVPKLLTTLTPLFRALPPSGTRGQTSSRARRGIMSQPTLPGQVPFSPPAARKPRRRKQASYFKGADTKFELKPDQVAEIQEAFDLFDSDGSGSIDQAELKVCPRRTARGARRPLPPPGAALARAPKRPGRIAATSGAPPTGPAPRSPRSPGPGGHAFAWLRAQGA